jgi:hypothetical protein
MYIPGIARLASIVVSVVYLAFSLVCLPGTIATRTVYAQYGSFFGHFPYFAARVPCTATEANAARAVPFGRLAPLGLGLCTISFTVSQILYLLCDS